jgi:hypothetical protein
MVLAATHANAADREEQERTARKACLTGDASRGTDILADLYIESKSPVYIYNQGRCYEQNNRCDEAIGRFREYLRKATSASDAERADAETHISDCEALLARSSTAKPTEPTAVAARGAAVEPPAAGVAVAQVPPASTSEPGRALRVAGVVTAAAGGAALIAAVALNLKANSMVRDLRHGYDRADDSTSKDYQTLSQAGYGLSATCLIGGAVLYYLGARAGNAEQVTVLPAFSADAAGAIVQGAF